jgi:hypothetical protein
MSRSQKTPPSWKYEIGYRKPPSHSRFRKGVSGNPGGRPCGTTVERAKTLVLKEAYRSIMVKDGETVFTLPAIQALVRQTFRRGLTGNGPTQRAVIDLVQTIEREQALRAENRAAAGTPNPEITDQQRAKALLVFLKKTKMMASMEAVTKDLPDPKTNT